LPPWPETRRVVEGYAGLVRFDPGPLLAHLEAQMLAQASQRSERPTDPVAMRAPAHVPIEPSMIPAVVAVPVPERPVPERPVQERPVPELPRNARRTRWHAWARFWPATAASAVVLGLASGFYWAAFARPAVLMAAINMLPAALAGPVRSAMDGVVTLSAPRRDGLRWIEVDDPRTRKADKLRINAE
jgi:hypothetical protein